MTARCGASIDGPKINAAGNVAWRRPCRQPVAKQGDRCRFHRRNRSPWTAEVPGEPREFYEPQWVGYGEVVALLADVRDFAAADIADRLHISIHVARRMLDALYQTGWVDRNDSGLVGAPAYWSLSERGATAHREGQQ